MSSMADDNQPSGDNTQAATLVQTQKITFKDRKLEVKMPSLEQITIFERLAGQFTKLAADVKSGTATGNDALTLYRRGIKILLAILVQQKDRDWLEDQFLDGMTLVDALPMVKKAFVAFREDAEGKQNKTTAVLDAEA